MAGSYQDGYSARWAPPIVSPRHVRSRTQSISSDRPSSIGRSLLAPPRSVSPEAAYIAASAASQIVTNDHDSHADVWYDEPGMIPTGETALVSSGALQLVNNFLDQLLFNFLQIAKSTTLSALRPAVSEVLKPKLARDAISNADEELREYLGGGEEDDFVQPRSTDPRDWDLELVWKRTRLRSMVYSSLGDMEEEDEDLYMEQEHLEIGADEHISDVISPAVAIFLTSVLEYMGELTLTVAGQAAYHRVRAEYEKEIKDGLKTPSDIADRIVVEDSDMERVALDRTLGRLWRGWKKTIRAPAVVDLSNRPYSRTSFDHARASGVTNDVHPPGHSGSEIGGERRPSHEQGEEEAKTEEKAQPIPEPADVPLPIGDNDVEEIEVPGVAYHSDDEDEEADRAKSATQRRKSFEWTSPPARIGLLRARSSSLTRSWPIRLPERRGRPQKASNEPSGAGTEGGHAANKTAASGQEVEGDGNAAKAEPVELPGSVPLRAKGLEHASARPESGLVTENMCSARITDVAGSTSPHEFQAVPMETVDPVHENEPSPMDYPSPQSDLIDGADGTYHPAPVSPLERPVESKESDPFIPAKATPIPAQRPETEGGHQAPVDKSYQVGAAQPAYGHAAPESSPRSTGRASAPQPARVSSLPRQSQAGPGNKASMSSQHSTSSHFINEPIPEVPYKTVGHSTRSGSNSIGHSSMERIRTRESDDGTSLPLQSNGHHRSNHTSGSSASSAAGRHKAFRTSGEHASGRADNVARNFEELIHSNQTITYTLTPEHMRNMDTARSTDNAQRSSSQVNDAKGPHHQRMAGMASDSRSQKPSPIAIPGSSAAPGSKPSSIKSPLRTGASGASSHHMSPHAVAPMSPPRVPGSLAREARVPGDSTADFAEFIKSTGPAGGDGRSPPPVRGANGAFPGQLPAAPGGPLTSSPVIGNEARRVSSASNRHRYRPREASVDGSGDNSDLIDFIRQGPPGPGGNNRIPRHVAPFRSQMEPDHTAVVSGGRGNDHGVTEVRHSQASTNATETSGPSFHSSVNSNTALLKNKPQPPPKMFDDDDMMPKRKTRRVMDPYAIDFSDEDDLDDDLVTPKPPPKKEESLADFLRNYEPPPEPVAPPAAEKMPKKKGSTPSLMTRLTRRDREPKEASAANGHGQAKTHDSRPLHSRVATPSGARSGHVPIQVHIPPGYESNTSYESTAGQSRLPSASQSGGRVPMKRFQPREAVSSVDRSATADLAAFLRDSEPPPSMSSSPTREAPSEEQSGGFSKMFRRQKKTMY